MKLFKTTFVALMFSAASAFAAPASESTIREMLAVMQAGQFLNGMKVPMAQSLDRAIAQHLNGKTPTPKQQQAIDTMESKMVAAFQDEMSFAKMEPMMIRMYQNTFTEEEVVGVVAFYKSPAGQAMVQKTPLLMQQLMTEMPKMMSNVAPKVMQIRQEFDADMRAASQ